MKVQTPFWPLLKNELAIGRCGGTGQGASVLLVYWLCVGALPLLVVFGDSNSRGNIAALFEAGFLPIIAFLFLSCLAVLPTPQYRLSAISCRRTVPSLAPFSILAPLSFFSRVPWIAENFFGPEQRSFSFLP